MSFRSGDANLESEWLCSRNDPIGNVAVVLAAIGVFTTGAAWPDLAVAAIMASLFLSSYYEIVKTATKERSHLRDR
jgi:Co/Zn/Cd efflux system component